MQYTALYYTVLYCAFSIEILYLYIIYTYCAVYWYNFITPPAPPAPLPPYSPSSTPSILEGPLGTTPLVRGPYPLPIFPSSLATRLPGALHFTPIAPENHVRRREGEEEEEEGEEEEGEEEETRCAPSLSRPSGLFPFREGGSSVGGSTGWFP